MGCTTRTWAKPARGLRSVSGIDIALLHLPSVFDFRQRDALLGPVAMARTVLDVLDRSEGLDAPTRRARLREVHAAVGAANAGSISGSRKLTWKPSAGARVSRALLVHLVAALAQELHRAIGRFRGRYDVAVHRPYGAPDGPSKAASR